MTPPSSSFETKADFLMMLANAHRLHVLQAIGDREMSVGSLVNAIGLSQSALSQHLAKLREGNLVKTRREAQTVYYSVKSPHVHRVLALLGEMFDRNDAELRAAS
jgi:ArsR family transcriptional regulator, virulence genes transcriptional regulator